MKYLESYEHFTKKRENISDIEQSSIVDELPNHVEESLSDDDDEDDDIKQAKEAQKQREQGEQEAAEKAAKGFFNPIPLPQHDSKVEPQQLTDVKVMATSNVFNKM